MVPVSLEQMFHVHNALGTILTTCVHSAQPTGCANHLGAESYVYIYSYHFTQFHCGLMAFQIVSCQNNTGHNFFLLLVSSTSFPSSSFPASWCLVGPDVLGVKLHQDLLFMGLNPRFISCFDFLSVALLC